MYVCMCVNLSMFVCEHMCIGIYIYACVCVCVCVCVNSYIQYVFIILTYTTFLVREKEIKILKLLALCETNYRKSDFINIS